MLVRINARAAAAWATFACVDVAAVTLGDLSPWIVAVVTAGVLAVSITTVTVLPCLILRRLPAPLAAYTLGLRHRDNQPRLHLVRTETTRRDHERS